MSVTQSSQLPPVLPPALPFPAFRLGSPCIPAQATQGLPGKGGAAVSPGQPGTCPTCLRMEAEWAMGRGRGRCYLPVTSHQGWAGTNSHLENMGLGPAMVSTATLSYWKKRLEHMGRRYWWAPGSGEHGRLGRSGSRTWKKSKADLLCQILPMSIYRTPLVC